MVGLARNSDPGDPSTVPSAPAPVIPLHGRLKTAEPSVGAGDRDVAMFWEQIFGQQGRSLADPATAEAHRITAATLGLLIEGARAEGVINEAQAAYLGALTVEAVQAPDRL
ncbi:hypothetical protein [Streptomyces ipomoeae]|uniref:hypothetical protein n=1 Tax=Streptomyces ipomoeae TaxID=103232 RepID=UPI0011478DF3|nr:hypothetical protein [Streptomyces ipomoeae]TQE33127.1 hypothetical protein Sipo7851_21775 [Streptomyces ipomoeae]